MWRCIRRCSVAGGACGRAGWGGGPGYERDGDARARASRPGAGDLRQGPRLGSERAAGVAVPRKGWGIALLLAAALAGCGSGGGKAAELTSGQRQALVAQLEAARAAAGGHQVAGAEAALSRFKASVARLRRSGALSD